MHMFNKPLIYFWLLIVFFPNSEDPDEMPHNVAFHRGQAPNCVFPNSEDPDEMPHDVAFHQERKIEEIH